MAEELITQVHNPADDIKVKGKQGGGGGWFSWFCGSCKRKGGSTLREHELVASAEVPKPQTINIDFTEENDFLLAPARPGAEHRKTLVLDLDETLVHSSFKPVNDADFCVDIELDNSIHRVYVRKRPGVDWFLKEVAKHYELVVFTASLSKYADPVMDVLDPERFVSARLFREHCVYHTGNYVKDLTRLGRPLEQIIIVDNSPYSFMFQPDNAVPITSWFSDKEDIELLLLVYYLETMVDSPDVAAVLRRQTIDQMLSPFLDKLSDMEPDTYM